MHDSFARLKPLRHTLYTLLAAAAALWLPAVGGVSCADRKPTAAETAAPSPDTLALVEGLRLFEEAEYDLAREQLTISARSGSAYIRAESFLYLNALETELGNYDAARPWLERYHAETRRLLFNAAEASARTARREAQLRRRNDAIATSMVVFALGIAGAAVFFRRRRRQPEHTSDAASTQNNPPAPDPYEWDRWLADAQTFKKTDIWAEIAALAAQKPDRTARVLTSARQDALDVELAETFSDFATTLRNTYPALTAGDVKMCCLSLLPLSPFGRALCYGSTETNIIKQRKHTIKKKLSADAPGHALFDFIFEARQ